MLGLRVGSCIIVSSLVFLLFSLVAFTSYGCILHDNPSLPTILGYGLGLLIDGLRSVQSRLEESNCDKQQLEIHHL